MTHKVTPLAMRPASTKRQCFYCHRRIGANHKKDCVLRKKKVLVRMVVDYPVTVPNHWDRDMIESHRNDGGWCASNALDELHELAKTEGCLCNRTHFEHLRDLDGGFLQER